ncbi:MAG: hydroxyacylglutathione hydrolase [Lautropia sp.]|nr:hydroxyacylglutathione hydrolase [Lautropia sp.]
MIHDFDPHSYLPARYETVVPIPARADNYIWRIGPSAPDLQQVVIVDPGEAAPVLAHLDAHALTPAAILITHHHQDHVAGLAELKARWPQARVIGPADCVVHGVEEVVMDEDIVQIAPLGLTLQVLGTPGHTADHLSYFCESLPGHPAPALFCGDTLFAGGCGRVFDGTIEQLFRSLTTLVATLPDDTRIYAAHEYTLGNLQFALAAEPGNARISQRLEACQLLRARQEPTLPTTLALENATNPFLRSHLPALSQALPDSLRPAYIDSFTVFEALRNWKNVFRPPV